MNNTTGCMCNTTCPVAISGAPQGRMPLQYGGGFKTKEDEIKALESYKKDIGEQMAHVDRRLAELRKG